jgi:Matrixin
MRITTNKNLILSVLACIFFNSLFSQCMNYPVSLQERVSNSASVILGKVTHKEPYIDDVTNSVYTLNKVNVTAWFKNHQHTEDVYVITPGGVYGNRATIVTPSLQLNQNTEYILFLEGSSAKHENKQLRAGNPSAIQTLAYAGVQGAIQKQFNQYIDLLAEPKQNEESIFQKIAAISGKQILTPNGNLFKPRADVFTTKNTGGIEAIISISPTTTRAGTIVAADQITITGSGFGAVAGNVFFSNADDGGASFAASGLASDIISWNDNTVVAKVFGGAGTGRINVNGFTSPSNLTVQYALTDIASNFNGFGSDTRQRYYLRNLNTLGGYTFQFNTAFASNAPAVAAFQRVLATWRCGSGVNFRASGTTSVATSAADGTNAIYFDATIPAGTLGICTSQFSGSANGICNLQNTVWWLSDVDIQFRNPPTGTTTWQFGPAAPSGIQYDFESVALHEVGHAHGLGHVIAPGQVMHFAIANGATARTLSANDLAGAAEKMNYSIAATCFNPAGSGTAMTAIAPGICSTLPVTLTAFSAKRINKSTNEVVWKTEQEINNDGFVIERADDGKNFRAIGFIKGQENSSAELRYSFTDQTAGPYDWYYRLTQKDLNGQQKKSSVAFVKGNDDKKWAVWSNEQGSLLLIYRSGQISTAAQIFVYSANGQAVFTSIITGNRAEFDCSHLAKGLYTYRIVDKEKNYSGKLILGNR